MLVVVAEPADNRPGRLDGGADAQAAQRPHRVGLHGQAGPGLVPARAALGEFDVPGASRSARLRLSPAIPPPTMSTRSVTNAILRSGDQEPFHSGSRYERQAGQARRAISLDAAGGPALRLIPAPAPALRLLTRYLRIVAGGPVPSSAQLTDAVVTHLHDLMALSLSASAAGPGALPACDPGARAARLAAIKADVGRHLTDSSLGVAALAARHGITPRYLHKLFEDDAMTYSQYVLDQRLALAYRRLRSPRSAARTVSSIAHDTGFGDLSYFNRAFRRRYGITPSGARGRSAG